MAADGAQTVVCPPPASARRAAGRAGVSLALLIGGLAAAACQREGVAHFRVPKESAIAASADPGAAAAPAPEGGLQWTLPAGWKQTAGGGPMRYATLTAPVQGKVEVTVIRLPGPAGGELANVNRWRNQIGLSPMAEAELPSARKVLTTQAGPLNVYDFTSAGEKRSRTIAGFAELQGESWFLKMTGDADAVARARAAFLELLGSIHLEAR